MQIELRTGGTSCSERIRRIRKFALLLLLTCVSSAWLSAQSLPSAPPTLVLQKLVSGLSSPVDFEFPKDGTGRFFILEQTGKVRIIQGGVLLSTPFLDITNLLESGGEKGLLGLAFHPLYAQNGRFFVDYTRRVSGQLQTVIAEYHVSSNDPNKADPTGTIILVIDQPFDNHNGGQLAFGSDTYLYIALGDGAREAIRSGTGRTWERCWASCCASTSTRGSHM